MVTVNSALQLTEADIAALEELRNPHKFLKALPKVLDLTSRPVPFQTGALR